MNQENTEQLIKMVLAKDDGAICDFYAASVEEISESFHWKFYAQQLCSALYVLSYKQDYATIHDLLQTFERLKFLRQDELLCACIFYELGHESETYMDNGVFISASRLSNFYTHLKPTHNLSRTLYNDLSQILHLQKAKENCYELKQVLLARHSDKKTLNESQKKTRNKI